VGAQSWHARDSSRLARGRGRELLLDAENRAAPHPTALYHTTYVNVWEIGKSAHGAPLSATLSPVNGLLIGRYRHGVCTHQHAQLD
jgi:hypothetical protein